MFKNNYFKFNDQYFIQKEVYDIKAFVVITMKLLKNKNKNKIRFYFAEGIEMVLNGCSFRKEVEDFFEIANDHHLLFFSIQLNLKGKSSGLLVSLI